MNRCRSVETRYPHTAHTAHTGHRAVPRRTRLPGTGSDGGGHTERRTRRGERDLSCAPGTRCEFRSLDEARATLCVPDVPTIAHPPARPAPRQNRRSLVISVPPAGARHERRPSRSQAMDAACNSDSDSEPQSRLDLLHVTAVAASMLLNLAAAAPDDRGGRERRSTSHVLASNLDGIAWQLPIKQDAPSTGSRPSGKRARPATPAIPPHHKRPRTKTNFFEAGTASSPSALHRPARAKSPKKQAP